MKKICFILTALLLAGNCMAQEGTDFEELTFMEALQKAGASGRRVFVDCYTKTCTPCKYMEKFIFPLAECGEYFNPNYVCLKMDMEEGEGPALAAKYDVKTHPTFLVIEPDGTLFCKVMSGVSKPEDDFVGKMKAALHIEGMNRKYDAGERGAEFMDEYIPLLRGSDKRRLQAVLAETMLPLGVEGLSESGNWELIRNEINQVDTPLFRYVFDNRAAFAQRLGRQKIEDKIMSVYREEFRTYKMMDLDFDSRTNDMKILEEEGYAGARALGYCLLLRGIINNKQTERIGEILEVLEELPRSLPDERERMSVIQELTGFDRMAGRQQKNKAACYLQEIRKTLQPANMQTIEKMISRFSD